MSKGWKRPKSWRRTLPKVMARFGASAARAAETTRRMAEHSERLAEALAALIGEAEDCDRVQPRGER